MPSDTFRPPCPGVYCTAITAIVRYVRCTLISWVEHNICLSTHSNNELSQRHKWKKSLIQLTLQGKCRSVEYHYWNWNLSGTPGLIKLFLDKCYGIINDHELSWQYLLPLYWEVAFHHWQGPVQYWVTSLGSLPIYLPNYSFLQPSGCLPCICCPDVSLLSCMLSNRITTLLGMTYIWLLLQHLILSRKS